MNLNLNNRKIMKAEEARRLTDEMNLNVNNKQYNRIIEKIQNGANIGKNDIIIYQVVSEDVKEVLIEDGYTFGYDGDEMVKISW